jgi:hypothetical protein
MHRPPRYRGTVPAAETDAARTKAGLTDPKAERIAREAQRSIADHVAEFIAGLESKGKDPKHVRSTRTYIERVNKLASIERIADPTPSSVSLAVTTLKTENLSARAVNAYVTAVESFSRRPKRDGRTSDYTLETLTKQNEQAHPRGIRRAQTPRKPPWLPMPRKSTLRLPDWPALTARCFTLGPLGRDSEPMR